MMTNNQMLVVTLLIGNKIHTFAESINGQEWEGMDRIEQAGMKNYIKGKLATAINTGDLMQQMQVYVSDAPADTATYELDTEE